MLTKLVDFPTALASGPVTLDYYQDIDYHADGASDGAATEAANALYSRQNKQFAAPDKDHIVKGAAGDDMVSAGLSDDTVYGGDGADYVSGADGPDTFFGGAGADELRGNA
ncbi:MAG: Ca2+-binding RTX toxin-like protein [Paracoccaceae bacterium]|jgi:Ca2+-binding RTX toxin-like protein